MKEGEKLSEWMDRHNKNAYDLANDLNVTPQSVYNQMKKERLSESFMNRLIIKGININNGRDIADIPESIQMVNEPTIAPGIDAPSKDDVIRQLNDRIDKLETTIELVKQMVIMMRK